MVSIVMRHQVCDHHGMANRSHVEADHDSRYTRAEPLSTCAQVLLGLRKGSPQNFAACAIATFYLWLVGRQVAVMCPQDADAVAIDAAMAMLQTCTCSAAEANARSCNVLRFGVRCAAVRKRLEALKEARASSASDDYLVLAADVPPVLPEHAITATPPAEVPASASAQDLAALRKLALSSLAPVQGTPGTASLQGLLAWVRRANAAENRVAETDQQILRVVEEWLLGTHALALGKSAALSDKEVAALECSRCLPRRARSARGLQGRCCAHAH